MKRLVLLPLLALSTCDDSTPAPSKPEKETPDAKAEANSAPEADDAKGAVKPAEPEPTTPPVELKRAEAAGSAQAKAEKSMGFKIAPLTGLYALAAAPAVPSWGASSSGDAAAIRDDDLRTTWACETGGDKPCVVGVAFAERSSVKAIRFFGASGPNWRDYKGAGRIKKARIHTDGGHYELGFKDGAQHHYVVFDAPIDTQTVTLEVLELHKGNKTQTAHVAELEVYGGSGPKRPPLDLDPAQMFVTFETEAWKEGSAGGTIRLAFLEDARGAAAQRLMRGTALYGNKGDRYLLVEKLFGTDCTSYNGSYILLDQQTRMFYPLGKLGGMAGQVFAHGSGLGFAIVGPDGAPEAQRAITLEGEELKIRRPSRKTKEDAAAARAEWGVGDDPLPRGPEALPAGCVAGDNKDAKLDALVELEGFEEIDPSHFVVCDLGEGNTAIVGNTPQCSKSWIVAVVDADGEIAHQRRPKKADGRGVRVAKLDGVGLVVEATKKDGASADLLTVAPDGIETWQRGASLVVRAPGSCNACDDALLGGSAKIERGDGEEAEQPR